MRRHRLAVSRARILAAVIGLSVAAAAVPTAPLAHEAHETFSAGEPGDARKPARIVPVTMRESDDGKMLFFPNRLEVRRGEQIKFVITNRGALVHEFVLASAEENRKHADLMKKFPDMEHDDPNGKTVPPNAMTEIVWRFSKRGKFEFACLIPGHREAGMLGVVTVK
jgi:uncharacterized cupredoxin-like copper-binding protein